MVICDEKLKKVLLQWDVNTATEFLKSENSKAQYLGFAVDDQSKISYISEDRQNRFDDDFWDLEKRKKFAYMGKVGKVLYKINDNIKVEAPEIERLEALIIQAQNIDFSCFEIATGEKIRYWYLAENSNQEVNALYKSCMKKYEAQDWFEVYEKNCQMLLIQKNGLLEGRAILWNLENENGDPVKFMDRIYGTTETVELFKKWAVKEGYVYKVDQVYTSNKYTNGVETYTENLKFCNDVVYEFYPYMDTMQYIDEEGNLYMYSTCDTVRNLQNTNGNPAGIACSQCGEIHDDDDLYYTNEGYVCSHCIRDFVWIESEEEYFHTDNESVFYCEDCETWHYSGRNRDDVHYVEDHLVCDSCLDRYYTYCDECEEYYSDMRFYEIHGSTYCQNCIDGFEL
jgi:formylmethanofuran dehydrogenase subunit E